MTSILQHVENYLKPKLATLDATYHSAIRDFAAYVEAAEAEAKACELLLAKGYRVIRADGTEALDWTAEKL